MSDDPLGLDDKRKATRDRLLGALAKLRAHGDTLDSMRHEAVEHVARRRDTTHEVIGNVEGHVETGLGGGVMAGRRLKTLHHERGRYDAMLAEHGHVLRGRDDEPG